MLMSCQRRVDVGRAQAGEARWWTEQHVQRRRRNRERHRSGSADETGALHEVTRVRPSFERCRTESMRERAERDEDRQRRKRQHEVRPFNPVAATRPLEQLRLRARGDADAGEDDRLLPVEALQDHGHARERQEDERRAKRRVITTRQPTRKDDEEEAGEGGGEMPDFDQLQRDEPFHRQQPRVDCRRSAAQDDQHAAAADKTADHPARHFEAARRVTRRAGEQQERGNRPRRDVIDHSIRKENRRRCAFAHRQAGDPVRIAAAHTARYQARHTDRLPDEEPVELREQGPRPPRPHESTR